MAEKTFSEEIHEQHCCQASTQPRHLELQGLRRKEVGPRKGEQGKPQPEMKISSSGVMQSHLWHTEAAGCGPIIPTTKAEAR